jgi:hypothetical protein
MPKEPKDQTEDSNLRGFRALLARKKAATLATAPPISPGGKAKNQPPRPKERMRRRP